MPSQNPATQTTHTNDAKTRRIGQRSRRSNKIAHSCVTPGYTRLPLKNNVAVGSQPAQILSSIRAKLGSRFVPPTPAVASGLRD
jgi:hypothetical protein